MGPPSILYTDNGPHFASEELAEFLMHQCTEHSTSSPHFPRSNGFIECQIRAIKTALNPTLPAKKPLETVLLDLRSTPIGAQHAFAHKRFCTTEPFSAPVSHLNQSTWRGSGTSSSTASRGHRIQFNKTLELVLFLSSHQGKRFSSGPLR